MADPHWNEPKSQAVIDIDYARSMEEQEKHSRFIDWDEYFEARRLPPPAKGAAISTEQVNEMHALMDALGGARTPNAPLCAGTPAADGYPVFIYGRRTGRGRVTWTGKGAWWRNLRERCAAPINWLRRVLFVAWVLAPPTPRQLRTPRRRRKLVAIHRSPFLLPPGAVTNPAPLYQVVPVLAPRVVALLPKWALRRLHLVTGGFAMGAWGEHTALRGPQPADLYFAADPDELVVARASTGALGTTKRDIDRNEEEA